MSNLLRDIRHAVRMLLKHRGYTLVAVLTLAVGIGANTAMFSVVYGVLLRSLPYGDPAQLVLFSNSIPLSNVTSFPLSPPEFDAYRSRAASFESLAAMEAGSYIVTGEGEPERLPGTSVTRGFFSLMNVQPVIGRVFVAEDYEPSAEPSVVISYGLWQRKYGGARDIAGRKVTINGRPRTILGVMPPAFDFPEETQVWGRLDETASIFTPQWLGRQQWRTIGRMKATATVASAQSEMDSVAPAFYKEHPQFYNGSPWKVTLVPLPDQLLGNTRTPILALAGAVCFLLLVACANVANLMLVRAESRRRELAIRAAIGASRTQLAQQLFTESFLLAAIGGIAGILLAFWGTDALVSLVPGNLPRRGEIRMDGAVLAFSAAVSLLTGFLFGLLPARRAARADLQECMRQGVSAGARSRKTGTILAAAQIALSMILLVGAGLLIRSVANVLSVSSGFKPQGLVTLQITPPGSRYPNQAREGDLYRQWVERIRAIPGVRAAAAVTSTPFGGRSHRASFTIEGISDEQRGRLTNLNYRLATPGYFAAMGVPLLQGRDLELRDTENAPRVAVVNRTLAARFWPAGDAIGKRISMGATNDKGETLWHEIVGVVGDVKHMGLDSEVVLEAFFPYSQTPVPAGARGAVMVVRVAGEVQPVVAAARRELAALDPGLPLYNVRTMEQQMSASVAGRRFPMLVLSFFSVVALLLAALGIYGVLADGVARRTREFGVRMALGANRRDIFALILRQGGTVIFAGTLAGIAGAVAATRVLRTMLFGVEAGDALTYAGVTAVLCAAALAACLIPARRAMQVEPLTALRDE